MQRKCKMSLKLQKQKIIEKLKKYDSSVDWEQVIDWNSILDSSLHFNENLNKICEEFGINPDLFDIDKGEIEHYENQELQREQKHYDRLFKKELKKIVKETPNIDRFYSKLYGYLNTLLKSKANGLIITGETGLGKSYQIRKFLEKNNVDYEILTTFSSPLELYQQLYDNKDKQVIVLDDVIKILDNDISKGILLSALWGIGNKRFVEYKTTSHKLKVPNKFEIKAKIILICNELPSKMENVLSRVLYYDLSFSYQEKIKLIYEICKVEGIPIEIADFIRDNTNEATKPEFLNLRTPIKFFQIYKTNDNWKELCLEQLKFDKDLALVRELMFKDMPERAKVQEFMEKTGKSRRTYFYYKKKISANLVQNGAND